VTNTEATTYLTNWIVGEKKVLKYYTILRKGVNYIILTKVKEDLYKVDTIKSSCSIGPYYSTKDMIEKLVDKEFRPGEAFLGTERDYKSDRIGLCECGLGETTYSDMHYKFCPLYQPTIPNK